MSLMLAVLENYGPACSLFNPFSPETREEHRMLYFVYDIDTGKAWCPVRQVKYYPDLVTGGERVLEPADMQAG